ncbi:hypothetical protein HK105_203670 [Polyrhizophydium stewartii]|uniref:RGS domain-containing protein n=1 Tax=Polyrhizophydium stewartii TaxID=2732419 RepID=A0ABR4NBS5_9FUNG|nr:hypothetical protein HK105_000238 [Polyrhizophydium stewartii]
MPDPPKYARHVSIDMLRTLVDSPSLSHSGSAGRMNVDGHGLQQHHSQPPSTQELTERFARYRKERRSRISTSILKCKERTSKHINQFIRIHVQFRDGKRFPLLVDRMQTIDYVTRQIEAEYAIRYLIDSSPGGAARDFDETDLLASIASNSGYIPIMQVAQLYDPGRLGLPFMSPVGDLLAFDDVVTAVTTDEVTPDFEDEDDEDEVPSGSRSAADASQDGLSGQAKAKELGSVFELIDMKYTKTKGPVAESGKTPSSRGTTSSGTTAASGASAAAADSSAGESSGANDGSSAAAGLPRSNTVKGSTLDDRLQSVLHNIISLQFFNEFCLQEYSIENTLFWIEAEIFKTIADAPIRKLFAEYLYLTYIMAANAPLALNISADVRRDIPWPIPDTVEAGIFDEAQDHAYAMIKGHAYARYESSKIFERFLEFKLSDRYTYIQGRVMWTHDAMFPNVERIEEIAGIVNILIDPSSEASQKALAEFGGGAFPSIASMLFRQHVLSGIIARYFPLVSPVIRGYFNVSTRSAWSDRQKRMQKEKKLTKFFGHRPTTEHMRLQQVKDSGPRGSTGGGGFDGGPGSPGAVRHAAGGSGGAGGAIHHALGDGHAMLSSQGSNVDSVLGDGQTDTTKRRKAEKLTGFFGETRLPKKQMKRQNLVDGGASGDAIAAADDDADDDDDDADNAAGGAGVSDDDSIVVNQNELSAEERRALNRRARKLRMMLGQTLDERTVSNKVTMPIVLQKAASMSNEMLAAPGAGSVGGGLDGAGGADGISDAAGAHGPSTASFISTVDSFIDQFGGDGGVQEDSRMAYKQRFDKLSQFLGHRINESDLIEAQAAAPKSPPMARPLTSEEKKVFQKKSGKLERILGSTVPAQAIVSYAAPGASSGGHSPRSPDARGLDGDALLAGSHASPMAGQGRGSAGDRERSHGSIHGLLGGDAAGDDAAAKQGASHGDGSLMKSMTEELLRFGITPAVLDRDGSVHRSSSNNHLAADKDDDDDDDDARKRAKQMRINKLRKLLGADLRVGMVIEKQFLDYIEKSISESVDDPEERKALTEDLNRLKSMAQVKTAGAQPAVSPGLASSSSSSSSSPLRSASVKRNAQSAATNAGAASAGNAAHGSNDALNN